MAPLDVVRWFPRALPPERWLIVVGILASIVVLAMSWNLPLLEFHGFRQTQTAISSYWMWSSHNWLAYPTPVLGYPWSIPFEFPFFQAVVLGVASVLPITLDQAGRLTSWLFAVATVVPLRICIREITGRTRLADTMAALFLLSPLYLFGARTFMIESTALFFAVSFFALAARQWRAPSWPVFLLMVLAATLAALVKITTFFGFGLVSGIYLISRFDGMRDGNSPALWPWLRRCLPAAIAVAVAIALTAAYIHFCDVQKAKTVWGSHLTSQSLSGWNYGNWAQKTSSELWMDVVFGRASQQLLGSVWVLPMVAAVCLAFGRGLRGFAIIAMLGYLVPFFVFANLHQVHSYYQHANGIFLVALAACATEAVRIRWNDRAALVATFALVAMMLFGFQNDFLHYLVDPRIDSRIVALSTIARQNTAPDDVLLVFGEDWSSEVPYYATRRAMMVKDAVTGDALRRMRTDPASYAGNYRVGMVMVCPNGISKNPNAVAEYQKLVATVIEGRRRYRVSGCDVYR